MSDRRPTPRAVTTGSVSGAQWAEKDTRWAEFTVEFDRGLYDGDWELDAVRIYPPSTRSAWVEWDTRMLPGSYSVSGTFRNPDDAQVTLRQLADGCRLLAAVVRDPSGRPVGTGNIPSVEAIIECVVSLFLTNEAWPKRADVAEALFVQPSGLTSYHRRKGLTWWDVMRRARAASRTGG